MSGRPVLYRDTERANNRPEEKLVRIIDRVRNQKSERESVFIGK